MKGFCISLDVSKGTSFYQGFKGIDEPITKPKKIEHNLDGFKELLNLKEKIRREFNANCIVIFESTGVYHKALQTYLDEHDFKYTIISPLLSAKVRKSDIRGTKTDAKDCASIAKVFYLKELRIYSKTDEIYYDLKEKSRYYDFLVDEMKRWKIEFRRILDIIYPGFDKVFSEINLIVFSTSSFWQRRKYTFSPETVAFMVIFRPLLPSFSCTSMQSLVTADTLTNS